MTIETLQKKYKDDYELLFIDYTRTNNLCLTKSEYALRFEFDQTKQDILKVLNDNLFYYSDDFIVEMTKILESEI